MQRHIPAPCRGDRPVARTILVTGASGLLGKALVRQFSKKVKVLGISRSGGDQTQICDLTSPANVRKLFEKFSFDLVIHAAAYSDVDGCERDPNLAHASNALAVKYLAENCVLKKIPLIYVSTDYVFDGRRRSPYPENHATLPVNIYGLTKLEGELWCRLAPVCAIVRTSWLFGAGHNRNFVNAVIERMKTETLVRVLDDQVDAPTYVDDLAVCLEKIGDTLIRFSKRNPGARFQEIFQICNAGAATRYGMALKIKEFLGLKNVRVKKFERKDIPARLALRPPYAVMSTKRFQSFFKMRLRSWEDSLRDYLSGKKEVSV